MFSTFLVKLVKILVKVLPIFNLVLLLINFAFGNWKIIYPIIAIHVLMFFCCKPAGVKDILWFIKDKH